MTDVTANTDDERVTVLVETEDAAVLATAGRDTSTRELLEALSELDEHLQHGLDVPMHHPREAPADVATDGGRA